MSTDASAPPDSSSSGDGGGGGGPPSARALKLQIFYRLQARGPRGAWTQYWTAFQRFLAARISLEEFHSLALSLLGEDMQLHNRFVAALLGVAHGGPRWSGPVMSAQAPSASRRPEAAVQREQSGRGDRELGGHEAAADWTRSERQATAMQPPISIKREPEDSTTAPPDRQRDVQHDRHHQHSSEHDLKREHTRHRRYHDDYSSEDRFHSRERGVHKLEQGQQQQQQQPPADLQLQHQLQAGSRKRSFSNITTTDSGIDGNAASKLMHLASSSHGVHHADDDHQSAKLLIGLGQVSALISPSASDVEHSHRSESPDDSDDTGGGG